MPEKKCSICSKTGVPLRQIKIPIPPFNLFYCEVCWIYYHEKISSMGKAKKASGKGVMQAANEIITELKDNL